MPPAVLPCSPRQLFLVATKAVSTVATCLRLLPRHLPWLVISADGLASCFSRKIEVVEATIPFTSLSPTQLYRTLLAMVGRMRRIMDNSSLPGTIDLPLCFLPSCHSVEVLLLCPDPQSQPVLRPEDWLWVLSPSASSGPDDVTYLLYHGSVFKPPSLLYFSCQSPCSPL